MGQGSQFGQNAVADARAKRQQADQQTRERAGVVFNEVHAEDQPPIAEPQFDLDAPTSAYSAAADGVFREFERIQSMANRELVDDYIAEEMQAVRAKHTIDGIVVAPEEAFRKVEDVKRERLERIGSGARRACSRSCPRSSPPWTRKSRRSGHCRMGSPEPARRTLELMERNELRERFNGRPLSELVAAYRTSSDTARRDVVSFVEDEAFAGWPTLTPSTATPDNLKAFGALRGLMNERRE